MSSESQSYYGGDLLATAEDDEGQIQVVDLVGMRTLHFSSPVIQSLLDTNTPEYLQLEYTAIMALGLLMSEQPERVLLVGLGGGALLHFIYHYFPSVHIDVIEKRPAVIQMAQAHFMLPDDPRIQLYCGDAQQLLSAFSGQYDAIFNDAYVADGPDLALYANEVYQQVLRLLNQDGVLVSNLWQRRVDDNLALITALQRLFPALAHHQDEEGRNCVLFAAKKAWSRQLLEENCVAMARRSGQTFDLHNQALKYGTRALRWQMRLLRWLKH